MRDKAAAIAERQHGVISRDQALNTGLSSAAVSRRLRDGRWESIFPGIYRLAGTTSTHSQRVRAACLRAGDGAVASHGTACGVHGLPFATVDIHVTVVAARSPEIKGVTVHRVARLDRADWVYKKGIPVTTVARTIIDLAAELSRERLEEVLDHALAEKLVHLKELARRLKVLGTRGRKGAAELTRLIEFRLEGSPRARQRGERRMERLFDEYHLPKPVREHRIVLPDGRVRFPDFAYPDPDLMIAIQLESLKHHSTVDDQQSDIDRDNDLVALGWTPLRFTYGQLATDPAGVAATIAATIARVRARLSPAGR